MAKRPTRRPSTARPSPRQQGPRVAIIVSRYNESVTEALLEGAVGEYQTLGVGDSGLEVVEAPGAYELPALAMVAAQTDRFDGVVCLGCLIKGETRHDRYIAEAVAHGLVGVTLMTGVPCTFGVITADTAAQARARAGGAKGNKGAEAMSALLDTLAAATGLILGDASNRRAPKPDKARGGRR